MSLYNLRDFGADPTGTNASDNAFADIIQACTTIRTNGSAFEAEGWGFTMDRGLYKITTPIVMNWPLAMIGPGWGAEIFLANGANSDMIQFNPQGSQWFGGAVIAHVKLNGNAANQSAASNIINAKGAVTCEFHHIWFEAPYTAGLSIHDDNLGGFGHHNFIHHCRFWDGSTSPGAGGAGLAGVGLYTHNSDENRITDNVFQNCGTAGGTFNSAAYFDDSGLQTLLGNVFVAGATNGIDQVKLASTNYNLVGNIFDGGTANQLNLATGASHASIVGNRFYRPTNTGNCLTIGAGSNYTVVGNAFESAVAANASNAAINNAGGSSVNIGPNDYITNGSWNTGVIVGGNTQYTGSGAPANTLGNNGDYYFRTDTPGTANQRLYVKSAGAWAGVV